MWFIPEMSKERRREASFLAKANHHLSFWFVVFNSIRLVFLCYDCLPDAITDLPIFELLIGVAYGKLTFFLLEKVTLVGSIVLSAFFGYTVSSTLLAVAEWEDLTVSHPEIYFTLAAALCFLSTRKYDVSLD